jgi:hypothetical protein
MGYLGFVRLSRAMTRTVASATQAATTSFASPPPEASDGWTSPACSFKSSQISSIGIPRPRVFRGVVLQAVYFFFMLVAAVVPALGIAAELDEPTTWGRAIGIILGSVLTTFVAVVLIHHGWRGRDFRITPSMSRGAGYSKFMNSSNARSRPPAWSAGGFSNGLPSCPRGTVS